jgi:hypothetical protein
MANTIQVPKGHLIMGLCIPLAVLLGYFLAEPLESGSLAVMVVLFAVLCVPLMMKWHHPLLVLSWNASVSAMFLPGRPYMWMIMAFLALGFGVLNRSVDPFRRFLNVPAITKSLLFLLAVVLLTAWLTGGIGLRTMGSARQGGKGYFFITAAVLGYFAFCSQRIPLHRAGWYAAMFFLPGLTGMMSNIIFAAGPGFYFLYQFFPLESAMSQASGETTLNPTIVRITGMGVAGSALFAFVLARHGIRGLLDLTRPWRVGLFALAMGAALWSGYRSTLVLLLLTFAFLFWLEGLHRTRILPAFLLLLLVGGAFLVPFTDRLPLAVQRTMSFLPMRMDPMVQHSARVSNDWRIQMWKLVLPDVPKYLLKGKGYSVEAGALALELDSAHWTGDAPFAGSIMAGDFHNGPLSVIIPFGVFGVVGFLWVIGAAIKVLYFYLRHGDPALRKINALILAAFLARLAFFLFVFGSLYADLFIFTGLVGFAVSLNGPPVPQVEAEPAEEALNLLPSRIY